MNALDYTIIIIYLIALLAMGVFLNKQTSKKDYFLGGRTLGWQPLALSIMATQLSAVSFISAPAFVGLREGGGLIWLSYELALPLAMLFLLLTILPFLHKSGVISVYEYLERRFDRSSRLIISAVFQISRAFATGIMIYAVSVILQGTMGIAHWQSVLVIGVVTIIYSLQGGMKAVVYGDAAQMILIVIGVLVCLVIGLNALGGWEVFVAQVDSDRLQTIRFDSLSLTESDESFGFLPVLFGGFVLYAAYYGCDQSEAQRSLSAKSTHDLKKMIMAASLLRFPITLLYCLAGLVIGTLVMLTPSLQAQIPPDKADWMLPIFILNYLPNGWLGLLVVAILAAAMSSVSSAINSLSAVSVQDFEKYASKQLSNSESLKLARWMGLFWGLVTLLLSFYAGGIAPTIIEAINKIGSIFYGPILACFVMGTMTKRVQARHINIALVLGVGTNIALSLFAQGIFWFWWNVSGFLVTTLGALAFSYLLPSAQATQQTESADNSVKASVLSRMEVAIFLTWFVCIFSICLYINNLR